MIIIKYLAPLEIGGISSLNVSMREFVFGKLFFPPSRLTYIRSNAASARVWDL
jgi:hypothetical protein